MTREHDDNVERICMSALQRAAGDRDAYVRTACDGDERLRLEVESLLAQAPLADAFLETAALEVAAEEIAQRPGLIGATIGGYEVLALLGSGGMGEVYRARDSTLKREVAIKVLPAMFSDDPDRQGRLEREARVLASLNHLNIGAIYGLEKADGVRALVLELVEGPTLSDRLSRGRLPLAEALAIARQITDALNAAHDSGVVHRDLKPANIKITDNGVVKVLDFGLAKAIAGDVALDGVSDPTDVSRDGLVFGTVGYMSPEQARGKRVDKRTDIWAFGCVLYEMLTGRAAFGRETNSDTIAAILAGDPQWDALPDSTPAAVRRLLQRCLQKDSGKRLHDIADARIELDEVGEDAPPPLREHRSVIRSPWLVTAVAVIAAAAAGFTLASSRQAGTPEVTRFSIEPPDHGMFSRGSNGRMLAVSPDGRTLALVARPPAGREMLWLRSLDAVEAHAVAGTDGAEGVFWSPDGGSIGFFAGGVLKTVSLGTGEIRTVCDVTGATTQASWSTSGVILFSAETRGVGGLRRVSATGGAVTPVTTPDRTLGETGHLAPYFLPDGEHFLYDATASDGGSVYIGSLGSASRVRLFNPSKTHGASSVLGTALAYAAPGYVLFVQDGTLMAQPLAAGRFEPVGEPVRVADKVQNFGSGSAAFSVSTTGVLAYWSGGEFPTRRLAWFRRDGRETAIALPKRAYGRLALSPDGNRAAVEQQGPAGATGIALLDLVRGLSTTFTSDAFSIWPLWSPDGASVIFSSSRGGMLAPYRQSVAAGEDAQRLFESRGATVATDWSADGGSVVYTTKVTAGTDVGLFSLSPASTPRQLVHIRAPLPDARVSPSGRWMTYTSNESGPPQIFVTSFPDARGRWPISPVGAIQARWRRDGKELYYLSSDRHLTAVPVKTEPTFEPGASTRLFDATVMEYAVADDGRFLIELPDAPGTSPPITLVLNWTAALKR